MSAAGISLALLIGATASPALARDHEPATGQVNGRGRTAAAGNISVSVRQDRLAKGRLEWRSADARFKVRCQGFDTYSPRVYVQAGPPAAIVRSDGCALKGPRGRWTTVAVEAEFVDNSSFTPGAKDTVNLTVTRRNGAELADRGALRSGNVTVR